MTMPRGRDLAPPRDTARAAARRRFLVLVAVLAVLTVLAAVYEFALRGDDEQVAAEPCPAALPSGTLLPDPSAVRLEVLNSTPTDGLAARTGEELTARGFSVTRVDNLPGEAPLPATEVHVRPADRRLGELVALQVPGAIVVEDPSLAVPVDLRLGEGFGGLAPADQVAAERERRDAAARDTALAAVPERCREALRTGTAATPAG